MIFKVQTNLPNNVVHRLPGGFNLPPFGVHQILALVVVCVALWVAASFWLGMQAAEQWIGTWQQDIRYHVYLDSEDEGKLNKLADSLRDIPGVKGVTIVDHKKDVQWMQSWLGDAGLSSSELGRRLPRSLEISPALDTSDFFLSDIKVEADRFEARVNTNEASLARVHSWLKDIKRLLLYAAIIMGLAMAIIISNTLRMTILDRSDEIQLMRLLGAPEWFVCMPFILEGTLLGAGAGFMSWLLIWPVAFATDEWLNSAGIHLSIMILLPPLMFAGGIVGCLGAVITTARIEPESNDSV